MIGKLKKKKKYDEVKKKGKIIKMTRRRGNFKKERHFRKGKKRQRESGVKETERNERKQKIKVNVKGKIK